MKEAAVHPILCVFSFKLPRVAKYGNESLFEVRSKFRYFCTEFA